MSGDEKLKREIETTLTNLGLLPEDLTDAVECIVILRENLADIIAKLDAKGAPRSSAIATDMDAIAVVEELTDRVISRQGILERTMQGEDTHDLVEEIKAKIQSLVVGEKVQARTIDHLRMSTQKLQIMKREEEGQDS